MPLDLPAPLAPWAGQLDLFPRDLVTGALGPMLRRLDKLIGPPRTDNRQGTGEPDGFNGLVRRGPYERLLLSEWLLATEAPDEFIRRAATGEHAFYQLIRKTPSGGRLSVALFDSGPDQWGTPRLVQIAVLIVLARRAQAAGMRFLWGVVQTGPVSSNVYQGVTPASVKRLLDARSPEQVTDERVETWRKLLTQQAQKNEQIDDAWLVGSRRFATLPAAKGASLLVASDVYETEDAEPDKETPRRVAVSVRAAIGDAYAGRGEAILDVPDPKLCVRLLRDPFAVQAGDAVRADKNKFAPASNLVFGAGNVKLFARAHDGALISYPVPNSPRAPGGNPKRFGAPGQSFLLCAGRYRKLTVTVSRTSTGKLWLASVGGGWWQLAGEHEFALEDPGANAPLGPCYGLPNGDLLALLPGNELLLRFFMDNGQSKVEVKNITALALFGSAAGYAYVARKMGKGATLTTQHGSGTEQTVELPSGEYPAMSAFLVNNTQNTARGAATVHHAGTDDIWDMYSTQWDTGSCEFKYVQTPVGTVVGIKNENALITLGNDKRTFKSVVGTREEDIVRAGANIVHATVSATEPPLLAYTTEAGEVAVYSLMHKDFVYRFLPQEQTALFAPTLPTLEIPETDELTGLLSKFAIREKLNTWGAPFTLVAFDLKGFADYNEQKGRDAGDKVLRDLGAYLKEWTNGTGRLASRIGADEFLLALPHEVQTQAAGTCAATIQTNVVTRPLANTGIKIALSLARCPQNGQTVEAVLRVLGDGLRYARAVQDKESRIHVA